MTGLNAASDQEETATQRPFKARGIESSHLVSGTTANAATTPTAANISSQGLHLLIDDAMISAVKNVTRKVQSPKRQLASPVVTSGEGFANSQPWLSVHRDPKSGIFRMWYNARWPTPYPDNLFQGVYASQFALIESEDGVHWQKPYRWLPLPLTFGAYVLDEGAHFANPAERYRMLYIVAQPGDKAEVRAAFSPDGIQWNEYYGNPVFPSDATYGDMEHPYFNPITGKYHALTRMLAPYTWTNKEGKTHAQNVRLLAMTASLDFKNWDQERVVRFAPGNLDSGVTQFYGLGAPERRGDLFVGFISILRDDLTASGAPAEAIQSSHEIQQDTTLGAGMGYTMLAWSRDGQKWYRDHASTYTVSTMNPAQDPNVYFGPNPEIGTWDHAHAWINGTVDVGDQTYLYYAGYKWGHKYHAETERQIGLLKIKRNRYVAWRAGTGGGSLKTRLLNLQGAALTLNADAHGGKIKVRVLDEKSHPISGYDFADFSPITGDHVEIEAKWSHPWSALSGRGFLEFSLPEGASLYSFQLDPVASSSRDY